MTRKRLIPVLLLQENKLVKTRNFNNPEYIGDPINTIKIFNEFEVDEILLMDIAATKKNKKINYHLLEKISRTSFVPLVYGGGIRSLDEAKIIFDLGYEKVTINSQSFDNPSIINQIANLYGSQAISCSVNVIKRQNTYQIWDYSRNVFLNDQVNNHIKKLENIGAGEIFLTDVGREGTWMGPDPKLFSEAGYQISIPLIAHGGIGSYAHIKEIYSLPEVSGIGFGSYVFYKAKGQGVVLSFPKLTNPQ